MRPQSNHRAELTQNILDNMDGHPEPLDANNCLCKESLVDREPQSAAQGTAVAVVQGCLRH